MKYFRLVFLALLICGSIGAFPQEKTFPEALQPVSLLHSGPTKAGGILSDDRALLRRVWLDLAGVLPTSDRVSSYLASNRSDKFDREIGAILQSDAFTERWTTFLADIFQNHALRPFEATYRNAFDQQLRHMVQSNLPWDQVARAILTGKGEGHQPQAAMFFWSREAFEEADRLDILDDQAGWITDAFLGIETQCISCHDGAGHLEQVNVGLSQMTRKQFWGLAAFLSSTYLYEQPGIDEDEEEARYFRQLSVDDLERRGTTTGVRLSFADDSGRPPEARLFDGQYHADSRPGQGMRPPRRGGVMEPVYPFSGEKPAPQETRREALARLLTKDRQFARSMVNRVWAHLFGEGFVEPLNGWDPLRTTEAVAVANGLTLQPRNSFLLEFLTDWFIQNQFDMRALLRLMVRSKVYQWNYLEVLPGQAQLDADPRWAYWRDNKRVRRLEAEAIAESYYRVLGVSPKLLVTGRGGQVHSNSWALPGPSEPSYLIFVGEDDDEEAEIPERFYGLDTETLFFDMDLHTTMMEAFGRGDYFNGVPRNRDVTVQSALLTMNHELFNFWLEDPEASPTVMAFIFEYESGRLSRTELIRDVYRFILFRDPTPEETQGLANQLRSKTPERAVADLFWTLLNHPDFIYK